MKLRSVLLVIFSIALGLPARAWSQEDDKIRGLNREGWLTVLKKDKDTKRRRAAVIVLEVYGPKGRGVVTGLCEALEKDGEPEIRREIALLLGRMGPDAKEAVPYLAEALKNDKAGVVREAAALALGDKLSPFAHEQVLVFAGALKDSHAGARAAAAAALNSLGEKAALALPQLTHVAQDKKADRLPRLYAVQIISRLQADQAEAGPLLAGIATDADAPATVRLAALDGLGRRERTSKEEAQALVQVLQDKTVELRRAAAASLATLGEQAAPPWTQVQARLQDADNTVRFQLIRVAGIIARDQKEAVTALAELAAKDAHVENRLAAIGELGQLGPTAASAADALATIAAQDARAALREAAAAALKKIRS
ncbi:MAG: HEAT repeat domain-containing protein [Gemmataceae bacterium]|nr:HEAT repeat domain-containing protein [Gemmataceae bacterium]